ncbi:hypothetical protein HPP92_018019 [Vanilla planifolia]|uniref:Uncharacterized protein n=1 Tax=Vanilla planifolia TaxID=51239 RepID=A0A835QB92_VANPL|nr:hypothetical protein HPP92_018019 [Vanilla planifolia]
METVEINELEGCGGGTTKWRGFLGGSNNVGQQLLKIDDSVHFFHSLMAIRNVPYSLKQGCFLIKIERMEEIAQERSEKFRRENIVARAQEDSVQGLPDGRSSP